MTTRRTTLVGKPASTPTPAAPPAGSEVTAPVAGNPVQGPGTATVAAAPDLALEAALEAFSAGLGPLSDVLAPHLRMPPAGQRIGTVRHGHEVAAPVVAHMVRQQPALAGVGDPDAIERGLSQLAATRNLAGVLRNLATAVEDTGRLGFDSGWQQARAVIVQATHLARRDKALRLALVPVRDVLSRGPQTLASTRAVNAAVQTAAAMQTRAARAQQRATVTARAHARVTQAHADRHPLVGTPVSAAVSQGPAVTTPADAVNSGQGPAPGR